MKLAFEDYQGTKIALLSETSFKITTPQEALELVANAVYQDCDHVVLQKGQLDESFYDLKTGFAGEVLQKFSNYQAYLAIVGDFENIQSNSLKSFIMESNKMGRVLFVPSIEDARKAFVK